MRVQRLVESEGFSPDEAQQRIVASDRNRADYLRMGYGVYWRNAGLYDLVINTARIDAEMAADLIIRAAQTATSRAGAVPNQEEIMSEVIP